MIHGDPVFTNILINQLNKLKFIDMRGLLGETLSCGGDAMYDYAKVYQSICGYDEILANQRRVTQAYRNQLQNVFWVEFKKIFDAPAAVDDLITVCQSLVLSLLPLHDECRFVAFVSLLENIVTYDVP